MNNDETPLEFSSKNIKRLGALLLPPGWDAVHRRVTPNIKRAGTHLPGCREALLEKKRLPQEHNTISLARARPRIARSGGMRTNHEITARPTFLPTYLTYQTSYLTYLKLGSR